MGDNSKDFIIVLRKKNGKHSTQPAIDVQRCTTNGGCCCLLCLMYLFAIWKTTKLKNFYYLTEPVALIGQVDAGAVITRKLYEQYPYIYNSLIIKKKIMKITYFSV